MTKPANPARRDFLIPAAASLAATLLPHQRASAADATNESVPTFKGIMQVSYIVPDLQQAMKDYAELLGVGPWFVTERFQPADLLYRGQPTSPDVTIGMSYSGHMNIELIQQRDDAPSAYKETERSRGFGFHHWGVATDDFDRDLKKYLDRGSAIVFSMTLGSGIKLAYLDTGNLPGMIELIQINDGVKTSFTNMFRAARDWDGKTLIATR